MQANDFSYEPFVTVTEKDTYSAGTSFINTAGQTITVATGSEVTVYESRNPFYDFCVFIVITFFFVLIVCKISSMIKQ